jgi:hypothetical protein
MNTAVGTTVLLRSIDQVVTVKDLGNFLWSRMSVCNPTPVEKRLPSYDIPLGEAMHNAIMGSVRGEEQWQASDMSTVQLQELAERICPTLTEAIRANTNHLLPREQAQLIECSIAEIHRQIHGFISRLSTRKQTSLALDPAFAA